ncbi:MAG: peptide chain release factor N(5)-glutamine methyltransferase [Pseudomonadota bacterium]
MDRAGGPRPDARRAHPGLTVGALLGEADDLEPVDRLALAAHAFGRDTAWFYAHGDDPVDPAVAQDFRALANRRRAGAPVAYLVGSRGFWTLDLAVDEGTLIPRPETELLVELVLEHLPVRSTATILDLGTGSGAIALALATERPNARITAVDASAAALASARGNADALSIGSVRFLQGSWLAPVAGEAFDVIVSNPPYLAADDPHLELGDLPAEPRGALVAGPTGLEAYERIVPAARAQLRDGGLLALEHGAEQQPQVLALCHDSGYADVVGHADLAGLPRAVTARR